jgi:hypothetical protein
MIHGHYVSIAISNIIKTVSLNGIGRLLLILDDLFQSYLHVASNHNIYHL